MFKFVTDNFKFIHDIGGSVSVKTSFVVSYLEQLIPLVNCAVCVLCIGKTIVCKL